jgi:hypothetical protein
MKRDMDLVRRILLVCEAHEHGYAPRPLAVDGYTDEQIGYHAMLMVEAGLLHGTSISQFGSPSPAYLASSLTWAGHEFLDAARDDTVWAKAKGAAAAAGGVAFDVLKELLVAYLKDKAGRLLGLTGRESST